MQVEKCTNAKYTPSQCDLGSKVWANTEIYKFSTTQIHKYANTQIHKYTINKNTQIPKYELERSIVHESEVWASMDALEPPALTPPVITL